MSTIILPAQFAPKSCRFKQSVNQRVSASNFGGSEQAIDLLNDRWLCSVELIPNSYENSAYIEAFIGAMRGQVNVVALYHFARPAPLGTIRGTLTLSAAAAQGASSITVAGAYASAPELVTNGTFDANTSGWLPSTAFASTAVAVAGEMQVTPTVSYGRQVTIFPTVIGKTYRITGSARVVSGSGTAFLGYSLSADGGAATGIINNANGAATTSSVNVTATATSMVVVCGQNTTGTGAVYGFDNISVKLSEPGTVLTGDMFGVGGFLLMAASDCAANSLGVITIPITNRLRVAQSSGASVTWDKPTTLFRLLSTSDVQYMAALTDPVSMEFGEKI